MKSLTQRMADQLTNLVISSDNANIEGDIAARDYFLDRAKAVWSFLIDIKVAEEVDAELRKSELWVPSYDELLFGSKLHSI